MIKFKQVNNFQILIVGLVSVFLSLSSVCEAKEKEAVVVNCKNLGKVTDIDNLLYQFYSNIDSQCLFEMSPKKLEEIWGIKILDSTSVTGDKSDLLSYESRRIFSEGNGFLIQKINTKEQIPAFYIMPTKKYAFENGWGGAMGKGEYPQLLPKPQVVSDFYDPPYEIEPIIDGSKINIPTKTVYQVYSQYYWLNDVNSDQLPVLFFETDESSDPLAIYFYSEARILDFK